MEALSLYNRYLKCRSCDIVRHDVFEKDVNVNGENETSLKNQNRKNVMKVTKTYPLGVMYGDGIGKEIVEATIEVIRAVARTESNVKIELEILPMGLEAIEEHGHPLPETTKLSLNHKAGWIMGPHDSAAYPAVFHEERNPSGELRHHYDLFANIRPAKSILGLPSIATDADIVIYRENTEGYYPDRNMHDGIGEWMVTPDVAISTGVFTRRAIERIAMAAFSAAMDRKKKVTIVHKANVIRLGTGLFKQVCLDVAKDFPEVEVDDYHVDAMAAHLVRDMSQFDVIVTENMFGDILSDLTGELVGSLGLAPSINANEEQAMAQAVHGSAPDIAGKGLANPTGIMLSTAMLFDWLGKKAEDEGLIRMAAKMEVAILTTLSEGIQTADLGGQALTTEFTEAILRKF